MLYLIGHKYRGDSKMKYTEIKGDLFKVSGDYVLAHCISSDAKMGAGIAVQFKKRFKLIDTIQKANEGKLGVGTAFLEGRVINLITKPKYFHKPTYQTLESSLKEMRDIALENNIKKVAMPKIGAGLDRLSWEKNREIIKEVFSGTDIEILVCSL